MRDLLPGDIPCPKFHTYTSARLRQSREQARTLTRELKGEPGADVFAACVKAINRELRRRRHQARPLLTM